MHRVQAERAGLGWAEGLRMDARLGQNLAQPSSGSRQPFPEGVKPKTDLPEITIQLQDRMVAEGLVKQVLHHH